MSSPPRDKLHGDEDDDFQLKIMPNKGYAQNPTTQHTNDPSIRSTSTYHPPKPNDPELSNQNNYSANVKRNGQLEQQEEVEFQNSIINSEVKQTCRLILDAMNSDLNATNIHSMTPQRSV